MITKGLLICTNKSLGGNTGTDEILEFSPVTNQWKLVDRMIQARKAHAVSVINFQSGLCVYPQNWFENETDKKLQGLPWILSNNNYNNKEDCCVPHDKTSFASDM